MCSLSHNVALREVLHVIIINHGLIAIQIIVKVNLLCH